MSFSVLNLAPALIEALTEAGYTQATPVQEHAIPKVMEGRDLMASAQTGTGKTAAFMLPALHRLITEPRKVAGRGPRVLVLTPTRELAVQVKDAAEKYARRTPQIRIASIVGGVPYPAQHKMLSRTLDVLVATPGRLLDHIERRRADLSALEIVVLDEADRMLDMGFLEDVERIMAATPSSRQTVMFSATFEGPIAKLAQRLLKNPERIRMTAADAKHDSITQHVHYVDSNAHKKELLFHHLASGAVSQAIVFTATKRDADQLAVTVSSKGHAAAALHGDMRQPVRNRTLAQFRTGQVRVLIATDVAARGIDVAGISHVFNYDLPRSPEDYMHRIGRTGRAGATGAAISFADSGDRGLVRRIERSTGQSIPARTVEGLEPKPGSATRPSSPRPYRGKPGGAQQRPTGSRHAPARRPYGAPADARGDAAGKDRGARHTAGADAKPRSGRDDRGRSGSKTTRSAGASTGVLSFLSQR